MKISFGNNYNNFDRNLYHNNGINKNGDIYHRQKTQTITRDQKYSYYYKQNPQTAQHDTLKRTPQNYGYNRQKNLNYPSKSPEIRYIYGPYPNSNLYPANKNVSKNIKKILSTLLALGAITTIGAGVKSCDDEPISYSSESQTNEYDQGDFNFDSINEDMFYDEEALKSDYDPYETAIFYNRDEKTQEQDKLKKAQEFFSSVKIELNDYQKEQMEDFKDIWTKNYQIYYELENETGVPAELIAAIHFREGKGKFDKYLHNGDPLGQATNVYTGKIYYEDWKEAALDALKNYGGDPDKIIRGDYQTYLDYAESYNGLGYRDFNINSPYIWSGTEKYNSGVYEYGCFNPNKTDTEIGVYALLGELVLLNLSMN